MARTIYETIFGQVSLVDRDSGREAIRIESAKNENEEFRAIISKSEAGNLSRFRLSTKARDVILYVAVRGLCNDDHFLTFSNAEEHVKKVLFSIVND
mmetsp:Transcript_1681/g.2219  ORF Transcript_1681/g.2219 Transcript_1681/m.2219 type:complete len:97 (+) Transcript_1681:624-914(+)